MSGTVTPTPYKERAGNSQDRNSQSLATGMDHLIDEYKWQHPLWVACLVQTPDVVAPCGLCTEKTRYQSPDLAYQMDKANGTSHGYWQIIQVVGISTPISPDVPRIHYPQSLINYRCHLIWPVSNRSTLLGSRLQCSYGVDFRGTACRINRCSIWRWWFASACHNPISNGCRCMHLIRCRLVLVPCPKLSFLLTIWKVYLKHFSCSFDQEKMVHKKWNPKPEEMRR